MWNLLHELYLLKKETKSPIQLQSQFDEKANTICCLDLQFKQTQMGQKEKDSRKMTHHENITLQQWSQMGQKGPPPRQEAFLVIKDIWKQYKRSICQLWKL